MSCGGSAENNANQKALQAAFAPHRGVVNSKEGPAMFHALVSARRAELESEGGYGTSDMVWRDTKDWYDGTDVPSLYLDDGGSTAEIRRINESDPSAGYTCKAVWRDRLVGMVLTVDEEETTHSTLLKAKRHAERLARVTGRKQKLHVTQESHAYARSRIGGVVSERATQIRAEEKRSLDQMLEPVRPLSDTYNMSAGDKREITVDGRSYTIRYDTQQSCDDKGTPVPGATTGNFSVSFPNGTTRSYPHESKANTKEERRASRLEKMYASENAIQEIRNYGNGEALRRS